MATARIEFFSNALCRISPFYAVLPNDVPDMMKMENKNYDRPMKALYLLHGYSGTCTDWIYNSALGDMAMKYNLAIICPAGENSFYLDREATGEKYGTYVGEELVAYTRKLFGLSDKKEDTYIGGYSMGGFGAIHTALAYPDVFEKLFAFSSALIIHNVKKMKPGDADTVANYEYYRSVFGDPAHVAESRNNPETLLRELQEQKVKLPGIYMAVGTEDFLYEENQIFRHFLEERHVEFEYHESAGGHDFIFWNQYVEPAIQWLLA